MSDLALGDNPVALRLQVYTTLKVLIHSLMAVPMQRSPLRHVSKRPPRWN